MTNEHDDRDEAAMPAGGKVSAAAVEAEETEDAVSTMDELMARYGAAPEQFQELHEGDRVQGTVVQISDQGAMIDVGTKSEGVIPRDELEQIRDEIHVGDRIEVCVRRIENEDGSLVLSKRQADYERAWMQILDKQEQGEILEATVVDAVKGGLLVDLGIFGQGFVPASHVEVRRPRNLQRYIGERLRLRVIEVERKRRRVVLSRRLVIEDEQAAERESTFTTLSEGQVRRGVVRRITEFGAFIDLGGVDGLLHVSELSWRRVEHPEEELRVGQPIDVMVLRLNREENRISLGRRQLQEDPWRQVPRLYREGQRVRAKVVRLDGDVAMVRLPVGVEGRVIVPQEMLAAPAAEAEEAAEPAEGAVEREPEPTPRLEVGSEIEVHIDRIIPVERELELSVASAEAVTERRGATIEEQAAGRPPSEAPLARGRYSDRRQEEEEEGAQREPQRRRERRRERPRERAREEERVVPTHEHAPPAAAPRTLGDLVGDQLRAILEEEKDSAAEEDGDEGTN